MSTVTLAKYNSHKRKTLDRVTYKYSMLMTKVTHEYFGSILNDFHKSLESGRKNFSPKFDEKTNRSIENLFEKHLKDTIYISVADGMQEIPIEEDGKLNAWADFPLNMPIEKTLTSLQKDKAKTLADEIEDKIVGKNKRFFHELIGMTKFTVLNQIERAYLDASSDWIAGKSTIKNVKESLSRSLLRSKSGIDRVFRTETTRYFNEARVDYFEKSSRVSHYQFFATTDGRISEICKSRDGYVIQSSKSRLKKYLPPLHPNCRSTVRPLIEKLKSHKKIIEKGMAINESSFPPAMKTRWLHPGYQNR